MIESVNKPIEVDIFRTPRYWLIKMGRVLSFVLLPLLVSMFIFNRFGNESLSVALHWPSYTRWIGLGIICLDLIAMGYLVNAKTRWGILVVTDKEIKLRTKNLDKIIAVNSILNVSIDRKWDSSIDNAYDFIIVTIDGRNHDFLVQISDIEMENKLKMLMPNSSPSARARLPQDVLCGTKNDQFPN